MAIDNAVSARSIGPFRRAPRTCSTSMKKVYMYPPEGELVDKAVLNQAHLRRLNRLKETLRS